jgi:hypothetical protein
MRKRQDPLIDTLIRPPRPCCQGEADPLRHDGRPVPTIARLLLRPSGEAARARLVAARLGVFVDSEVTKVA